MISPAAEKARDEGIPTQEFAIPFSVDAAPGR
jgi:hypothetical protein